MGVGTRLQPTPLGFRVYRRFIGFGSKVLKKVSKGIGEGAWGDWVLVA